MATGGQACKAELSQLCLVRNPDPVALVVQAAKSAAHAETAAQEATGLARRARTQSAVQAAGGACQSFHQVRIASQGIRDMHMRMLMWACVHCGGY